jgi:hypothetical protein
MNVETSIFAAIPDTPADMNRVPPGTILDSEDLHPRDISRQVAEPLAEIDGRKVG